MIIHIEGFDQNNNFIHSAIETHYDMIQNMPKWSNYNWYKDGVLLQPTYNSWDEKCKYQVMFNHNYINLILCTNNHNHVTPLINIKSTVRQLKNILSIKDNIYFNRVKLNDNMTIESYNINDMDCIYCAYKVAVA